MPIHINIITEHLFVFMFCEVYMDKTLFKLYDLVVDNDIEIYEFDCIDSAMIIKIEGTYAIALDMLTIKSEITEKEVLAHELGHYFTNALYTFKTPLLNIDKYEKRADKWAIKTLISKSKYLAAKRYARNTYELTEELDVSIETVIRADEMYC